MLVLSRRPGQRVHFPTLNITVEVLQAKGGSIRLGIQAPPEVPVVREELLARGQAAGPPSASSARHERAGRLNTAVLALHLAQRQLQTGLASEAEATLQEALTALESLEHFWGKPPTRPIDALLVEDDRNEEILLASYLRMSGFHIETVHDGVEALDFLAQHPRPDCVLLDMRLPRCDGPAIISAIRGNPAHAGLRIFAVTGSAPEDWGITLGPGGLDGWFRKPLNPARLVESLRQAIGQKN